MLNKKKLITLGIAITVIIIIIILFALGKTNKTIRQTISSFFPIREERAVPVVPPEGGVLPEGEGVAALPTEKAQLTQITKNAVAGAAFYNGKVRFIEKSTGHLYESGPQGENPVRLSNTTIPKIFEVYWSPKKDHAVLKYLQDDNLRIFSAFFNGSSTQGIFLSPQISAIAVSPNEDKIFYIMPSGNTNLGIVASFEDKNKRQIFSLPFGDFIASWPQKYTINLLTRPSGNIPGFLYDIDLKNENIQKILGGIFGLEALWAPGGDKLLYSTYDSNNKVIRSFVLSKNKGWGLYDLEGGVLPDKCLFSQLEKDTMFCAFPSNNLEGIDHDDWLKGKISFSDSLLFKINYVLRSVKTIQLENYPDLINPFLSDDEGFLFFTNKADGTLWSLKLK